MSSVINLIAGKEITETSPNARSCTMSFEPCTFPVGRCIIQIWDTVGLNEPEMGANGYLPAIQQGCELVQQLMKRGSLDLLLFCIRGNRLTATTVSNYRLFYEVLCNSKVLMALVITHLELEADMEKWWDRNNWSLESHSIKSASHACVTGLPTHSKYQESRQNILRLLERFGNDGRMNIPLRLVLPVVTAGTERNATHGHSIVPSTSQ